MKSESTAGSKGVCNPDGNLLEEFAEKKQGLLACASDLENAASELGLNTCVAILAEVRRNLLEDRFNVVVLGGFKRGKSTLINAMVGSRILPMGVVPLTSVITKLWYGKSSVAEVLFRDGRRTRIEMNTIDQYVTERLNPANAKGVAEVDLQINSDLLRQGVFIIDTPGIGSVYERNTLVTYDFLSRVDVAVLVLGVDPPISQGELDFLEDVRNHAGHVFVVLNKIDLLGEEEAREVLEFSRAVLRERSGGVEPRIFPLSAKQALEAKEKGSVDELRTTGYHEFEAQLRRFFAVGKAEALLNSARKKLARVASEVSTAVGIESGIASRPVAEMDGRIDWLNGEIQAAKRKLEEFEVLLDSRVSRMVRRFEERLDQTKARAGPELVRDLESFLRAMPKSMGRRELLESLQSHMAEAIERTYAPFVQSANEEVSEGLKSAIADVLVGADQFSRDLESRVAEKFGLGAPLIDTLPVSVERTTFYFDQIRILRCESIVPPELPMVLPRQLYRRAIAKKARETLLAELEKHAGRIRYDFDYRLSESARRAKAEVRTRMLSSIESMESAYMMGLRLRGEASKTRDERLSRLRAIESRLELISQNLRS